MEQNLKIGDKALGINLDPVNGEGKIKAAIDGRVVEAEIISIDQNTIVIKNGASSYRVSAAIDGSKVYIHLAGRVLLFENTDAESKAFSRETLEFGARDRVLTPMPGKIVKVLVAVGDEVKAKQPLVIVESMKMENELKSPSDGVITAINFKAGDLVPTDQPIILLNPQETPK